MVDNRHPDAARVVLVIDDDTALSQLLRESLRDAGVIIERVGNDPTAADAFARTRPDLVLVNAQEPGADAFGVCAKLRQQPGGDAATVVMVADAADADSLRRSYDAGATDFITTPVNGPVLTHRVLHLLRGRQVVRALEDSEERLTRVQRAARIGSWDWDIGANEIHFSEEACRIFGLPPRETSLGRDTLLKLLHPADYAKVAGAVAQALREVQGYSVDYRITQPDGRERFVRDVAEPVVDETGRPVRVRGTVQDISEREKAASQMRMLAYNDALTGLPNRERFKEQAADAVAAAHRVGTKMALIYLDLDHFKRINDTLGHTAGDTVLRGVARALTRIVRGTDIIAKVDAETSVSTSLARLGGDEFTIMLTGLSRPDAAARVAERIKDALSRPLRIDDRDYVVTGSMGIATFPDDGRDVDALLRNADIAMYAAKEDGRNTYRFFSKEMNALMLDRLALESDLRTALKQDQLVLHFQPLVDAVTRDVVSLGALVRWQHPERGLIPPLGFIGIAEETGLIVPLGEWVIVKACQQAKAWHDAGLPPVRVSVNITSQQLSQSDLVGTVRRALDTASLAGEYLELEITEGSLTLDVNATRRTLRELKEVGLTLSVDDFGTGYSSMAYLKRFPLDALKIDRSFIRDLGVDANNAAITRAVIALAKALDLATVAEGVELEEQLSFLVEEGCDLIQGYLISRPLPADKITGFLARRKPPV